MRNILSIFLYTCAIIVLVNSAPAPTKKTPPPPPEKNEGPQEIVEDKEASPSTGLYYDQYLQKIVKLLESDESFRKTMETANFDDIKDGKLSTEIYKIPREIRDKLDMAKKEEITRLRKILHAKMEVEKGRKVSNSAYLKQIANHLDGANPHSFEAQDLTNLIKSATKDLENFDEERHKDFKRYEMNKALRRQEKLRQMSEEDRKKAEREYQEMRKKHEDHPDMNHPGSKAQMEEVWQEEDGLKGQEFQPKTFFRLHDLNGDNSLDPMELEALFEKDLAKVYDSANPEDDMIEMEAERSRMRQHVMTEVDSDKNGLISLDEFMRYTDKPEFEKPNEDSYKTVDQMIDDDDLYSKEEMEEYKQMIEEQEADVKEKLNELRKQAQTVVGLKSEVYQQEQRVHEMGDKAQEYHHAELEEKKEQMKEEEKVLQEMHEDVKEQSREILEMKEELRKQEVAVEKLEEQREPGYLELQRKAQLSEGDEIKHMEKQDIPPPEHMEPVHQQQQQEQQYQQQQQDLGQQHQQPVHQ
ncbi:nucleobindin-2-like isoform X1 [Styela clava]